MVEPAAYLTLAILLLVCSYAVFHFIVRRDYRNRGRLGGFASFLQLLVFAAYFSFPYLFNPPEWPWFWRLSGPSTRVWQIAGLAIICLGFIVAFGTMAWFGMGRAFGVHLVGLMTHGPYRVSRNPQILGGYLLVIGTALQWPSIYALGWIFLFAAIAHWMVIVEEEHLEGVYGEEYREYCRKVPRYLCNPARRNRVSA